MKVQTENSLSWTSTPFCDLTSERSMKQLGQDISWSKVESQSLSSGWHLHWVGMVKILPTGRTVSVFGVMVSRFTVQWMLHFLCGSRSTSTRGSFISLRCLATWSQFPPLGMFRRGLGTRGEDLKVRFARGRKLDLHLSEMTDMQENLSILQKLHLRPQSGSFSMERSWIDR